jgi:hypothetical protein
MRSSISALCSALNNSAHSAAQPSWLARNPNSAARLHAQTVTEVNPGPVFNLTVEGTPEYYANGILTHNCDAVFWTWNDLRGMPKAKRWGTSVSVRVA